MNNTKTSRTLVCFTASFPFGKKETFFENELPFLASAFDKLYILPMYNPTSLKNHREVPSNVVVYPPLISANKVLRVLQGIFNRSPMLGYFRDFFYYKVYNSRSKLLRWANSFLNFRRTYFCFSKILQDDIDTATNVLLYSYWAEAPLFITKLVSKHKKILRMHRVDFYLDVNENYLPLRSEIYDASTLLLPISENIKKILIDSYAINSDKIFLNRLGVCNNYRREEMSTNDTTLIRIVSCSRVDPVKRVHIIANALSQYQGDIPIEWHHFGDGKVFDQLKEICEQTAHNVKIHLHGWANQEQIFHFYKSNFVTWFINVSESEGVPVSIMEAMSFGIPVIATDVGATSEIVNRENGLLIPKEFNIDFLLAAITNISEGYSSKQQSALATWRNHYNAEKNYRQLIERLSTL